jgi:hypothetical protein
MAVTGGVAVFFAGAALNSAAQPPVNNITIAPTGAALAGSAGIVGWSRTVPLLGVSMTSSGGSIGSVIGPAANGAAVSSIAGLPIPVITTNTLPGGAATVFAGTLATPPVVNVTLIGAGHSSLAGIVGRGIAETIAGAGIAVAIGNMVPQQGAIIGVAAVMSAGLVLALPPFPVPGTQANMLAGAIIGQVVPAIAGIALNSAVGALATAVMPQIGGVILTSSAGVPSKAVLRSPIGALVNSYAGFIVDPGLVIFAPPGASVATAAGVPIWGNNTVAIAGVASTGSAGQISHTQASTIFLIGAQSAQSAGVPALSSVISPVPLPGIGVVAQARSPALSVANGLLFIGAQANSAGGIVGRQISIARPIAGAQSTALVGQIVRRADATPTLIGAELSANAGKFSISFPVSVFPGAIMVAQTGNIIVTLFSPPPFPLHMVVGIGRVVQPHHPRRRFIRR